MITNDGTVKIGDFGFARAIIGTDVAKLQSYTAVGSPIYAAPNVCLGQEFSGLCDVWSVGCILY
jgi:NIMA (never in mitosis gene a)-related kinase